MVAIGPDWPLAQTSSSTEIILTGNAGFQALGLLV